MAINIITVLCEGPHDVAFISRILKTIGYVSFEHVKIGEYPFPMNKLIGKEIPKINIEELNLTELRRNLLPHNTLHREDNYIFLYSLGGDSKRESRQKMLQELLDFITAKPGEFEVLPKDTKLSLLYFFDADEGGIDARINQINEEIKGAVPEIEDSLFKNHTDTSFISKLKVGNFIFSETDGKGKLEDILLPLMREQNTMIFSEAQSFLEKHHDDHRVKRLKVVVDENGEIIEKRVKGDPFDKKKSLIGAVGQLQKSGKSNVVCISDTDYLSLEKIRNNEKCLELISFFNHFTNDDTQNEGSK
jgi:hypothetical protein